MKFTLLILIQLLLSSTIFCAYIHKEQTSSKKNIKICSDEIFINDNKVSFFEAIQDIFNNKEFIELFIINKETNISKNIEQILYAIRETFVIDFNILNETFESDLKKHLDILNAFHALVKFQERILSISNKDSKEHKFFNRLDQKIKQMRNEIKKIHLVFY